MIYTFYVFNKKGTCLYYTEWSRPRASAPDALPPAEDAKLMFGLVFSLKQLMAKMNPVLAPAGTASSTSDGPAAPPAYGPDQGFFRFVAGTYALHHYETVTGYRFILTSDVATSDLRPALHHIYAELFIGFALRNPLYVPGTTIESTSFAAEVDRFVRSLVPVATSAATR